MLPRKLKVWLVKRKARKKREGEILGVGDLINLEIKTHNQYLKFGRQGAKMRDEAIYWKGKRDGIKEIWQQKVK